MVADLRCGMLALGCVVDLGGFVWVSLLVGWAGGVFVCFGC